MDKQFMLHKLHLIRKEKGFTQKDMALALECKKDDYAFKENGKAPISTEEWLKIAKALNTPVGTFFINVSGDVLQDGTSLIYRYNRLSSKGRITIMAILDALLLSQWSEFKVKVRNKKRRKDEKPPLSTLLHSPQHRPVVQ